MKMTKCFIGVALMLTSLSVWAVSSEPPPEQTALQQVGVNDAIQTQLAELIKKSINAAEKTGEFLQKELPDVIKQFLLWKFWEALAIGVFGLLVFLPISLWVIYKDYRSWDVGAGIAFGSISAVTALLVGFCALLEALKIHIAPKVYLLEWAATQVR